MYIQTSLSAVTHIYAARQSPWDSKALVSQPTGPPHDTLGRWNEVQRWGKRGNTITDVISPQLCSSKLVFSFDVILGTKIPVRLFRKKTEEKIGS